MSKDLYHGKGLLTHLRLSTTHPNIPRIAEKYFSTVNNVTSGVQNIEQNYCQ